MQIMYVSENVANRIKNLAKIKKISVRQLLADVGLGFNTMANMKTSMPKADNLAKIADYLDCSVDYLLGRTASPSVGSVGSAFAADYSSLEEEHIKKYRQLSLQGKQTVDGLLDNLLLMNNTESQEKKKCKKQR